VCLYHLQTIRPIGIGSKATSEFCWYAVGEVHYVAGLIPHLEGNLTLYMNNGLENAMRQPFGGSVWVEIFDDGTISYQQQLNRKPVGGLPPITLFGTCVQNVLVTGIQQNEVVTISVHRKPDAEIHKID